MSYIVDRRLNSKNKSAVNRQRFLRRYRQHINRVLPGNKEFVTGDRIPRPPGGAGGGGGSGASDHGEGMDDFVFQITQEEFLDFMFEDLELPNMVKRQLAGSDEFKLRRAGISDVGSPGRLNIVRSMRAANARRIALTAGKRRQLAEMEKELAVLEGTPPETRDHARMEELLSRIAKMRARIHRVPWLDDFDLKYNLHVKEPNPSSKAVMFCLMDVSGSMNQSTKDMAKRFFILLYLFLKRNYEHTEVVFIRHHTSAKEVDEEEFFYSRETGGTIVSSALRLMNEILDKRYPLSEWNVYGAQASDGDNWNDDSSICYDLLVNQIMHKVQYYSYIEITPRDHQALWYEYEAVRAAFPEQFAMEHIMDVSDIYPVFRELFHKKYAA